MQKAVAAGFSRKEDGPGGGDWTRLKDYQHFEKELNE